MEKEKKLMNELRFEEEVNIKLDVQYLKRILMFQIIYSR